MSAEAERAQAFRPRSDAEETLSMTTPPFDTVTWFQIGSADPDAAQRFYGDLFGWTATADPGSGPDYRTVKYPGSAAPSGGITALEEGDTPHATFGVMVRDVAAVCARTAELGGKALSEPRTTQNGLIFADLLDPDGNRFLVFTPPAH
ncbi:VOC family protein [Nocardia arthritidis]|uniref:VOC family protein n=1 Tax=Nocardia arthritidis TaxID=228602 RepID=A0A6G9YD74_9NOCA|nr:VOC family protein [Nocardia arthritidis]QIS11080.1 VOC family protein [Nocardia arthritidis]